ncbi:MAG: hypothetical protein JW700_00750 [Candidatus Aenigmarchaeota archaeon]|nr:hypothetical protein [Candidatus Aenigmarchaeota archaeon]
MVKNLRLIGVFLILLTICSVAAFALRDQPQYHSYTRTIKSCDRQGNCVLRDLLVQCSGEDVLDITFIGKSLDVPESFDSGDLSKWCK